MGLGGYKLAAHDAYTHQTCLCSVHSCKHITSRASNMQYQAVHACIQTVAMPMHIMQSCCTDYTLHAACTQRVIAQVQAIKYLQCQVLREPNDKSAPFAQLSLSSAGHMDAKALYLWRTLVASVVKPFLPPLEVANLAIQPTKSSSLYSQKVAGLPMSGAIYSTSSTNM